MRPRPVTRGRRVLAGVCDLVAVTMTSAATATVLFLGAALFVGDHVLDPDTPWVRWTIGLVPFLLTATVIAVSGQTIGHAAVQLRFRNSPLPTPLARGMVFLAGIGGYQILNVLPVVGSAVTPAFVFLSLVLIFTTRGARGLPGLAADAQLVDARAEQVEGAPE